MTLDAAALHRLASKYNTQGPRYTSYPTALQFESVSPSVYDDHLAQAAAAHDEAWSLYAHVPFCQSRCTFCACAVVATPHHDRVADPFVRSLLRELALLDARLGARRRLAQLHLGGGTPSYLAPELLAAVLTGLDARFERTADFEGSIELDPRVTSAAHLDVLARAGFRRISLGVQDLDAEVQRHIGRHQTRAQTETLVEAARARGLDRINIDLVYGLPAQTEAGLVATVDAIAALRPGRVALYGYAHVPWMRSNQRSISTALLPSASARLSMFIAARTRFESAGYVALGLDHFALPDDPLALAAAEGRLHRNFMGYTVAAGTDLLGLGPTAIGDVRGLLVQNEARLGRWQAAVEAGQLPAARGRVRTADDVLRGRLIADLMCRGRVDKSAIEREHLHAPFDRCFATERETLRPFVDDGLVVDDDAELRLTPAGRTFVRNVAMAFDAYQAGGRHSTTV